MGKGRKIWQQSKIKIVPARKWAANTCYWHEDVNNLAAKLDFFFMIAFDSQVKAVRKIESAFQLSDQGQALVLNFNNVCST